MKTKQQKASIARKNAEAEKASRKALREQRGKGQDLFTSPRRKGKSMVPQSKAKK